MNYALWQANVACLFGISKCNRIFLEYRLNKLIEENTQKKQQSLHEMVSARKAAEILHCTARNVPRIAEREHVFTLVHGNRRLYKKSQIEELANLR